MPRLRHVKRVKGSVAMKGGGGGGGDRKQEEKEKEKKRRWKKENIGTVAVALIYFPRPHESHMRGPNLTRSRRVR